MDFGERRLTVMDEITSTTWCSLLPARVQAEKDGAVAQRKARAVNDLSPARSKTSHPLRRIRPSGDAHPSEAAENSSAAFVTSVFRVRSSTGRPMANTLIAIVLRFWERAAALDAPVYLHPGNPVDHPSTYAGHSELWGPGLQLGVRDGDACATPGVRRRLRALPQGKAHSRSRRGDAAVQPWRFDSRWQVCNRGGRMLASRPLSTFGETSPSPRLACARANRCAVVLMGWARRT